MSSKKAQSLRKKSIESEKLLWSRLRNRKVEGGIKLRRQHPIGSRYVDFFCAEGQLAIEIDVSGHANHASRADDLDRELELHAKGIRLLRFWNGDVLKNVSGVVEAILYAIDPERSPWGTPNRPAPHLNPLSAGEETSSPRQR